MASMNHVFPGLESTDFPRRRKVFSNRPGFSQPQSQDILSLEDLLRVIRAQEIQDYKTKQLLNLEDLGEGASYRVRKCLDRSSQELVAVKRIKLPDLHANAQAFEYRVTSVLRDIEIMTHPELAKHDNILQLLGIGWDNSRKDIIPYLVTELATGGTLRSYLQNHQVPATERMIFCKQIISGLWELHWCNVIHGDLKLDNILVCPVSGEDSSTSFVAKISDFGHSMILYSDEVSLKGYSGTDGYKPPEVCSLNATTSTFDIRKCDLWTLGLLCWETIAGGAFYYDLPRVKALLKSNEGANASAEQSGGTSLSQKANASNVQKRIEQVYSHLRELSVKFTEEDFEIEHPDLELLCGLFNNMLDTNPRARAPRSLIPLLSNKGYAAPNMRPRQQLVQNPKAEKQWTFESFKPHQVAKMPINAQRKILSDIERLSLHKDNIESSRALLQIAFAHGNGFGVRQDHQEFRKYLWRSATNGLQVAKALLLLCPTVLSDELSTHHIHKYSNMFSQALKFFNRSLILDSINDQSSFSDIKREANKAALALNTQPVPAAIYAVYHNLTSEIPIDAAINTTDPSTGETPLATACRTGNLVAVMDLLDLGADPSIAAPNGCLPLHWLFVFNPSTAKTLADELTKDWWFQHINSKTSEPYVLDKQFPFVLHGTPLAFAVITRSKHAIEVLLNLGADPLLGYSASDDTGVMEDWGDCSPLSIAVCLHLWDQLYVLWNAAPTLARDERYQKAIVWANAMSSSSSTERQLIHNTLSLQRATLPTASFLRSLLPEFQDADIVDFSPLVTAVNNFDFQVIKALLSAFYHNFSDAKDALFEACVLKACDGISTFDDSVQLLTLALDAGCNIDTIINEKTEPTRAIDFFISQYQSDLVRWILAYNPSLKPLDSHASPLYEIIVKDLYTDIPIEGLLRRGAPSTDAGASPDFETPLHAAVRLGFVHETTLLLEYGADVNARCMSTQMSVLQAAVQKGNIEVVKLLLDYSKVEVDIDQQNSSKFTALYYAITSGHIAIIKLLLMHGANVEQSSPSALIHAVQTWNCEIIDTILSNGDGSNISSATLSKALLTMASSHSRARPKESNVLKCFEQILSAGADPNALSNNQSNKHAWAVHEVFQHFAGAERLEILQLFGKHGADLGIRDVQKTSILHLASFVGDLPLIERLLQQVPEHFTQYHHSLRPDILGNKKQTPLHDAVRGFCGKPHPSTAEKSNYFRLIELLVEQGSSIPYKPYSAENTDQDEDIETSTMGTSGSSSSSKVSLDEIGKGFRKLRNRIREKKLHELAQRSNKVTGFGILDRTDIDGKTALSIASAQNNGSLVGLLLSLHIKSIRTLEKQLLPLGISDSTQDDMSAFRTALKLSVKSHQETIASVWHSAIELHKWNSLTQFYRTGGIEFCEERYFNLFTTWKMFLYGLQHRDLDILSLFFGNDIDVLTLKKILKSQEYTWPTFSLDSKYGSDASYLLNKEFPENASDHVKINTLSEEMDAYFESQGASPTSELQKISRFASNTNVASAAYFFGGKQVELLICLSGAFQRANSLHLNEWVYRSDNGIPVYVAPLSLLYDVWAVKNASPIRSKVLKEIIEAHKEVIVTKFFDTKNSIGPHVDWLMRCASRENEKLNKERNFIIYNAWLKAHGRK